jgi:predicted RNA binding protein YcfA (HicA-like mRNA interferase family)
MAKAKVRAMVTALKNDGWFLERQKGSHRQFRHATKPGTVTVPGHSSDTLGHGMVNSILRQADLTLEDLK